MGEIAAGLRCPIGETDRIVSILAQGHGKVRAVAKGVRKPGSRFGARLVRANDQSRAGYQI